MDRVKWDSFLSLLVQSSPSLTPACIFCPAIGAPDNLAQLSVNLALLTTIFVLVFFIIRRLSFYVYVRLKGLIINFE
jgi:hypothetical protein